MAALAPTPTASVTTATIENIGLRSNLRAAVMISEYTPVISNPRFRKGSLATPVPVNWMSKTSQTRTRRASPMPQCVRLWDEGIRWRTPRESMTSPYLAESHRAPRTQGPVRVRQLWHSQKKVSGAWVININTPEPVTFTPRMNALSGTQTKLAERFSCYGAENRGYASSNATLVFFEDVRFLSEEIGAWHLYENKESSCVCCLPDSRF